MNPAHLTKPWHQVPICVWDVETTGTEPETDAVVQVAIALFEGGELTVSDSSLVNPRRPIPPDATKIHGITDAKVKHACSLLEAVEHFTSVHGVGGCFHAAYNATFDRAFLVPDLVRNGVDCRLPWLDPLVIVRQLGRYWPGSGRHKLEAVCQRWGIELGNAHDAEADAIAAGHVLFHDEIRKALGDLTACEVLRRQEIHRAQQELDYREYKTRMEAMQASQETEGE